MAAESNTPIDIEIWIEKIIKSCETVRHRINAEKLLDAYISRLREEGMPFYQTMHIDDKFQEKRIMHNVRKLLNKRTFRRLLLHHTDSLPDYLVLVNLLRCLVQNRLQSCR